MGAIGSWGYRRKKRGSGGGTDPRILGALKSLPREFRYKDLKKATNNFDDKLKMDHGQGGFAVMYRGVLPRENVEVAVKKFSWENINGTDTFFAELTVIARLSHKHLVRLLGWCHGNGKLLLVYDFMPNGNLGDHLFDDKKGKTLSWERRYKIISGVASALHYLHNDYDQKVLHRNLAAGNIFLDSNYNARLGNFGLALALDHEKTSVEELEGVAGTVGYIAPEYFLTSKATRESDIYGFGVVVLEVVCGQRRLSKIEAGNPQLLVDRVWTLHREGRILEAMDKRLVKHSYVPAEAERLLLLGLACSHPIATQRPKTKSIIQITSGSVSVPYVPPFKPAFAF